MSDAPANQGISQGFPNNIFDFVDPKTGRLTPVGYRFLLSLWTRTGGGGGSNITVTTGYVTMSDVEDVPAQSLNTGALLLNDSPSPMPTVQSLGLMFDEPSTVLTAPNAVMAAEMATMQDAPKTYPGLWAMAISLEP